MQCIHEAAPSYLTNMCSSR